MKADLKDAWKDLLGTMRPSDVTAAFSEIGFKFPRKHEPDSQGWIRGVLLPDSIKHDKNPSTSINANTGSWIDFGSDQKGDLIGAIESSLYLDFVEAVKWAHNFMRSPLPTEIQTHTIEVREWKWYKEDQAEKVAEYPYTDESGNILYYVDRYEGTGIFRGRKAFPPRMPNGKSGVKKDVRVLYHLDEVSAQIATGGIVFLVEGEKDVETMRQLGQVATCNMGGAGNWFDQYNESLRDADIVLLPDNDESGYDHAAKLEAELQGVAKSLNIVALPGLPYKGDATDWFAMGNTLDDLRIAVVAGDMRTWTRVYSRMPIDLLQERAMAIAKLPFTERDDLPTEVELATRAAQNQAVIRELINRATNKQSYDHTTKG